MPRKRRGPLRTVEWLPHAQAAARRMCRVHANGQFGAPLPALLRRAQRTPSSAGWRDTARKVRNLWRNRSAACHHSHVPHARCYLARIMQLAPCAYVDVCPLPRCDCTRWRRFQRQRCARRASTDATVTVRLARGAAGPQVRRYRCCAPAAPRLAAGARTSETPNGEAAR
jgi:hypothetical protein